MMIKSVCEQLTSVFENGTTEIQYDYVSNLSDGRGITCGKAGFTTAGDDATEVIELYTKIVPDNHLAKYLPVLKKHTSDTSQLSGFRKAWKESCKDKHFLRCQDQVTDELYWNPSQKYIEEKKFKLNISKAVFYDTIIQHGEGDDPDSFGAIYNKTNELIGEYLKEEEWLKVFVLYRKRILEHSFNEESREVWSGSTGRCDTLLQLIEERNFNLHPVFKITWEHEEYVIQ